MKRTFVNIMFEHLDEEIQKRFLRACGCKDILEVKVEGKEEIDFKDVPLFTLYFGEGEQSEFPERKFNFFIIMVLCNDEKGVEGGFWNGTSKRTTRSKHLATWYDSYYEAEREAEAIGFDCRIEGFNTKPF